MVIVPLQYHIWGGSRGSIVPLAETDVLAEAQSVMECINYL